MFTIGQISKLFDLPISTIRYYDKEGLFPQLKREKGIRKFGEKEIEALEVIECLKASGLEIKEIKQYIDLVSQGASTYEKRKELFESRKQVVEEELIRLQKTLDMLKYKCWYYDIAAQEGNEDRLKKMIPKGLPSEIKKIYENAHSLKEKSSRF